MGFVEDVTGRVTDYLQGDYEVQETSVIPQPKDVPHGKVAKKVRAATFTIDLRDSTGLLDVHQKQTAGKIHKAYLYACASSVNKYGGYIRNFRGDGLLALWPADDGGCSKAVNAAMTLKWLLSVQLAKKFEEYRELDYGIGIDVGDVFIVRAGVAGDTNDNDLVFISPAVNYAVHVAEQAKSPSNIEICTQVYNELRDEDKYVTQDGSQIDIWSDGTVQWRDAWHSTKCTQFYLGHGNC